MNRIRTRPPVRGVPAVAALLVGLTLGATGAPTLASGDVARGQEKSATCAACHGANGIATAPQWPILAGQYTDYLEQALRSYRSGSRQNAIMQGFATQLSDQDIEDLAAYFNAQDSGLVTAPRAD